MFQLCFVLKRSFADNLKHSKDLKLIICSYSKFYVILLNRLKMKPKEITAGIEIL